MMKMMTVKELIRELEKMPNDALVTAWNKEVWELQTVESVELDVFGNVVLKGGR